VIGGSSADIIFGSVAGTSLNLRGNGTNIINSTISIGSVSVAKDDGGVAVIRSAGNVWGDTSILQGTLKLGCSYALPATTALTIGKAGSLSAAVMDLNGTTQIIMRLLESHYTNGTQRITSILPATLVVSNLYSSTFGTEGSVIDGQVSLVKANTGTLTLTGTNTMSGSFTIVGGTNVISATGTLGINCTNITITAGTLKLQSTTSISDAAVVTIADGGGAKMELEGVEETVLWLNLGDKPKLPGRYSATGGPGIIVDTVHFSGTGVLKVLRGPSATIITLK
jgi:autotransporter-associated beta strand protein